MREVAANNILAANPKRVITLSSLGVEQTSCCTWFLLRYVFGGVITKIFSIHFCLSKIFSFFFYIPKILFFNEKATHVCVIILKKTWHKVQNKTDIITFSTFFEISQFCHF